MQKVVQTINTLENKPLWGVYKVFIFMELLVSFKAWFTWSIKPFYWSLFSIFLGILFFLLFPRWYTRKIPWIWFIILLLVVITGVLYMSDISFIIHTVAPILPLFFILALRPNYKENLLKSVTKYLSILIGISLIGWLLYLLGLPLPFSPVGYGEDDSHNYQYLYENYGLFLRNVSRLSDNSFQRFSSVFLEPGYLGCLMTFLLYINEYKKNIENTIFLLALIISLSLAGYILFVFTILGYSLKRTKKHFSQILFGSILVISLYGFGIFYNNGDNPIKKGIIDRLEYDQLEQNISGYNRSSNEVDDYFWNDFVTSENLLLGGKSDYITTGDVDWKTYIIAHGLVSFILFICFVAHPCIQRTKSRYDYAMLSMLYFLVFVSTMHLSISMMYLTLYTLGVNRIKINEAIM